MCQFKTAQVSDPGGGGCTTCRCQAGAAAAEALRQLPQELVERIFAQARAPPLPPPPTEQVAMEAEAEEAGAMAAESVEAAKYSAGMASELAVNSQPDNNNNSLKAVRSLPCEKRRVQFADELGGTLTEVRLFESEPYLPPRVEPPLDLLLQCHFDTPSAERALRHLMKDECSVKLSGLRLDPVRTGVSMTGYALVKNVSFQKRVFVRITADSWRNSADLEADFAGSLDERHDAFEFELRCEIEEVDFEFCVCYEAEGRDQEWDSNGGSNYQVSLVKPRRATFSVCGDESEDEEYCYY